MNKTKMVRVELIFSQAVSEDFMEEFRQQQVAYHFTKVSNVTGVGFSNPKLGDAIWPQLNELFVVYCTQKDSEKIVAIVEKIRERYPIEGIACFVSEATMY